jgi:hypothetical protein
MSNRLLAARVPTSRPYGLRLSWPGAQSANPPELMTGRFVRLMRRRDEFGWGRANASRRTSNDGCPVLMALEVVELGDTKEKARTCGRVQQAIRDLYGERSPSQPGLFVRLATTGSGATDVFIRRPLSRAFETFEATSRVDVNRTLRFAALDASIGRIGGLQGSPREGPESVSEPPFDRGA